MQRNPETILLHASSLADIHRSAQEISHLRLNYLRDHPRIDPHLLLLNIDYSKNSQSGQQPFTLKFRNCHDVAKVMRWDMVKVLNHLCDVMRNRRRYYTGSIMLGRSELGKPAIKLFIVPMLDARQTSPMWM